MMTKKVPARFASLILGTVVCLSGCGEPEKVESAGGTEKEPGSTPITADSGNTEAEEARDSEQQKLADEAIGLLRRFAEEIVSIKVGDIKSAKMAVLEIELLEIEFQELGKKMEEAGPPNQKLADSFRNQALSRVAEVQDERFVAAVTAIGQDPTINQMVTGAANRFRDALDRQIFRDYGIGGD